MSVRLLLSERKVSVQLKILILKKSNNIIYLIGYSVFGIYLVCVYQRKVSVQLTQQSASSHRKQLFHADSMPQPTLPSKKKSVRLTCSTFQYKFNKYNDINYKSFVGRDMQLSLEEKCPSNLKA